MPKSNAAKKLELEEAIIENTPATINVVPDSVTTATGDDPLDAYIGNDTPPVANPFAQPVQSEAPWFDKGMYLFEIKTSKLNKKGNPYMALQVIASHDNRRVRQYLHINFHLLNNSEKAAKFWMERFNELRRNIEMPKGVTLQPSDYEGKRIAATFTTSGRDNTPFFASEDFFEKTMAKLGKAAPNIEAMGYNPADFDNEDDMPWVGDEQN